MLTKNATGERRELINFKLTNIMEANKIFKIGDRVQYSFMRIRNGIIIWAAEDSKSVQIQWDGWTCHRNDRFDIRADRGWLKRSNVLLTHEPINAER